MPHIPLKTTDYKNDIRVFVNCKERNAYNEKLANYELVYFLSITPESEAEYVYWLSSLEDYIADKNYEITAGIKREDLKAGRIRFTVSPNGNLGNVYLESSSGFKSVDDSTIKLMHELPGKWNPAMNAQGEKVSQDLVLFFGTMGC